MSGEDATEVLIDAEGDAADAEYRQLPPIDARLPLDLPQVAIDELSIEVVAIWRRRRYDVVDLLPHGLAETSSQWVRAIVAVEAWI